MKQKFNPKSLFKHGQVALWFCPACEIEIFKLFQNQKSVVILQQNLKILRYLIEWRR